MKEMLSIMKLFPWMRQLKPGDPVMVRWTNCGNRWQTEATVKTVNKSSFRVTLTKPIMDGDSPHYPVGQEIVVPNPSGESLSALKLWTWNNTILPFDLNAITEQVDDKTATEYSRRR